MAHAFNDGLLARIHDDHGLNVNDLECNICNDLLWKPVECIHCHNLYCAECIKGWLQIKPHHCPHCQNYGESKCHPLVTKQLSRLRITCMYQEKGCSEILTYEALEKHEKVCGYRFQSAQWQKNAVTLAAGRGEGNKRYQLNEPSGIFVDEQLTIYIADMWNNRIMAWKAGAKIGEVVAGGKGEGSRLDQLKYPTDVILDRKNDALVICDRSNRRVMRWPCHSSSHRQPEIIIDNIDCFGLAIDDQGSLYVSDTHRDEVRRYDNGGNRNGIIVAGGHGTGARLNQLNWPTFLFVDAQCNLYVSDHNNYRVVKWTRGVREGVIVAGGNGRGEDLTQVSHPQGLWVDGCGRAYVVDSEISRVVRWEKGAKRGTVLVGENGYEFKANQLFSPKGLSFDRQGHIYVADQGHHRVQRFSLIVE